MNLGEIVKDAVRYPLSDWKKILILGIIIFFSGISNMPSIIFRNVGLIVLLFIITLVIGCFSRGYQFRIIKSSLSGFNELPDFNSWIAMFIDGIKVSIVMFVYFLPVILIIVFTMLLFGSTILKSISNPFSVDVNTLINVAIIIWASIIIFFIIYPIQYLAVAHMVNNQGKLSTAFRFREILTKIGSIGWINLIIGYIVIGIIFLIIYVLGLFVTHIIGRLTFPSIGTILLSLIVGSYLSMYINRSVALFYNSK